MYAFVVKDLDVPASGDDAVAKLLTDAVATLNTGFGGDWLAADNDKQFAVIEKMAGNKFFENIRGTAVVSLYNNELAWPILATKATHGNMGCLTRGFNDLE